jgi:hypothetical protein
MTGPPSDRGTSDRAGQRRLTSSRSPLRGASGIDRPSPPDAQAPHTGQQQPPPSRSDDHPWLDDGFLTTTEAAALLTDTRGADVLRWCHAGVIRSVQDPISKRYLVCAADIQAIAERCDGRRPSTITVRAMALPRTPDTPQRERSP